MPNKIARCGRIASMPALRQSTCINPSMDQYTIVNLLTIWTYDGMKLVGNHAPPMELIERMRSMPRPFACAADLLNAERSIPNAEHAVAAAITIKQRFRKFENISI